MPSFLIALRSVPGHRPFPNSLSQHVLICRLSVGPLTLRAPRSSGQPSFCAGKKFLWFAFPRSCWLISHIGILLWGGEWGKDGKGFSLGVGMWTSVRVNTRSEDRPLQLLTTDERPAHTAEGWVFGRKLQCGISCLTHNTTLLTATMI